MKKNLLTISLLLISYFLLPVFVSAQFNVGQFNMSNVVSLADELSVDLIPTYPKPNSQVYMNLRMYTEDLNSAIITWARDGKDIKEGRGITNFNFKTGGAGSRIIITVKITLQSGVNFSKEITINPASIDLLWQSDSYVPPFYKGKALFPPQGTVLISAMPEFYSSGVKIGANRLIYKWTVNDEVSESQSGYGRSTARVAGPILGIPLDVEVLATDPITNLTAENFMTINPIDPSLVFYENNPLYGIVFERSINEGIDLQGEEVSVVAAPFFMNVEDRPFYNWSMNGKHTSEVSGLSATFRKPEGVSGSTLLFLKAENQKRILQFAEGGFKINYKND